LLTDLLVLQNPRLDHVIQGLGCEGAELSKPYWAILRRHNLIRTAEEEEHRRFTAAPPVAAAELESAFATSVRRLLCACVRACPKTDGIAVNFVQAGQLHLQLFYSEEERLHERWLSLPGAIEELGLPEDLVEADVVFHAVKRLFADALEQLPREEFVEEDDPRTAEWRRKLEVSLAEQRLLNFLGMGDLRVDITIPDSERPGLLLKWDVDPRQDRKTMVEIQCHRASRCSHIRDSLLTAEDGPSPPILSPFVEALADTLAAARTDKMACIYLLDGDDNPLVLCWSYQSTYSEGHYKCYLEEGEEYFFILVMPTDPGSIVNVSIIASPARPMSPPRPPSVVSASPMSLDPEPRSPRADSLAEDSGADTDHEENDADSEDEGDNSDDSDYKEDGDDMDHEEDGADADNEENSDIASSGQVSPSPTPEPARVNGEGAPAEILPAREPAPATAAPVGSFGKLTNSLIPKILSRILTHQLVVLGSRLRVVDILTVDKDRWYEGRSSEGVRAVVGILTGEEVLPEERSKRPRVD
jgi:hypothetical protein